MKISSCLFASHCSRNWGSDSEVSCSKDEIKIQVLWL